MISTALDPWYRAEPALRSASLAIAMRGLIVGVFASLLFFAGLGQRDLNSSHEARAAQNAQSILDDHDWLLPRRFDLRPELQKPPMYYWLVAAIAWLRGGVVDGWAVRMPAAGSGLLCVLFLWYLGEKRGHPLAGVLAGLVLASCVYFTWMAHVGRIDMPLTCAITVALGSFELCRIARSMSSRLGWAWLGYSALAVGVLLKGPIALVLVGLVVGGIAIANRYHVFPRSQALPGNAVSRGSASQHLVLTREAEPRETAFPGRAWERGITLPNGRGSFIHWLGILWLLVLTVPWFVWADWMTDHQLWNVFFWHHNVERGLGGAEDLAVKPWWFYGPRALLDLAPWSIVLLIVAWLTRRVPLQREERAGLIWFGVIFLFLSCMSFKRIDYLLPAYPGIAIFLGCRLDAIFQQSAAFRRWVLRLIGGVCGSMLVGWTCYSAWIVPKEESHWPYLEVARMIRNQSREPIIFFRAEQHLLAFHIGRPIDTILEWENLEVWANREFPVYFVMPADCARDWQQHLSHGQLEEVLRVDDWLSESERPRSRHDDGRAHQERSLVVMRSCPRAS